MKQTAVILALLAALAVGAAQLPKVLHAPPTDAASPSTYSDAIWEVPMTGYNVVAGPCDIRVTTIQAIKTNGTNDSCNIEYGHVGQFVTVQGTQQVWRTLWKNAIPRIDPSGRGPCIFVDLTGGVR